jgi:nucleoside-diphosphate-sugar epimerase
MARVLVLGATGCVGGAVAEAFLSRGVTVLGIARSANAATSLLQAGVHPVRVTNVQNVAEWLPTAEGCSVVVEALGDKGDKTTQKVVSEALIALRGRKPNVAVIFTSGMFSYGQDDNNKLRVFTEEDDDYAHSCKASLGRHPIERAYRSVGF